MNENPKDETQKPRSDRKQVSIRQAALLTVASGLVAAGLANNLPEDNPSRADKIEFPSKIDDGHIPGPEGSTSSTVPAPEGQPQDDPDQMTPTTSTTVYEAAPTSSTTLPPKEYPASTPR